MARAAKTKKATTANATVKKAKTAKIDQSLAVQKIVEKKVEEEKKQTGGKDFTSSQVDSHVPGGENLYQVVEAFGVTYSIYLMWSDLKVNHNKYYVVQVLQRKGATGPGQNAMIWTRYGRVGNSGVTSLVPFSYEAALKTYAKQTGAKQRKGYREIKMALGSKDKVGAAGGDKNADKEMKEDEAAKSKLNVQVQEFVNFIFDKKLMEASVVKVGYDVKKLPLGELSNETVLKGYQILKKIENVINKVEKGSVADLTSDFYTYIPHNFGMKKMSLFIIDTLDKVKEKIDLIQALVDIQVAHQISDKARVQAKSSAKKNVPKVNPTDQNYDQLKCSIKNLDSKTKDYGMINDYLQSTREGRKLTMVDCFELEREGEKKIFNPEKLGNKKLLWHGSRFSNFVGILSQGMRIAPPEAPSTGYMFGKGVYFADLAGKSAPYCRPELSNGIAVFVLCEVALGNTNEVLQPTHSAKLPKGCQSTHALGRRAPNPAGSLRIDNGNVEVPVGKVQDVKKGYMGCNEFIVYNTNQVRMRYLVRTKVN